ncbi:DEAD/DEAH box helicase [Rubrimonas cliftonensis]|uniref:Part of AAA domain-containing protein n=1 Tax=Rubrimonas cliftonensis TaxID=89524 RepID=A0A1H4GCS0_9RHOB|nr:AAA domain-containing protein [Rubrimonas cliftonensis]SEB07257.1 Part of AAA domain-containing protein [Rubrimonas cliftonensis]
MSALGYFRATLADGARPRVDFSRGQLIAWDQIRAGVLDEAFAAGVVRDAARRIVRAPDPDATQVLIAPAIFAARYEHGAAVSLSSQTAPFVLPALLDAKGVLRPHATARPWIARDHLDGAAGDAPQIGALEACDRFLEHRPREPLETWPAMVGWLEAMIEAVAGAPLAKLALPDHVRLDGARLLAEPPPVPARHVLDLLNDLDRERPPGCLPALVRARPCRPLLDASAREAARRGHLGQLGGLWPLSTRQREALHHVDALAEGEILAVAGPPGTGKTTLIRSLVATRVVEAALMGADAPPPIIVVASTNNRAIRSAVESLDGADLPAKLADTPLARRWIPSVGSFAMLMPAAGRARAFEGLQMGRFGPQPDGVVVALHAPEALAAAERSMLDNATAQFARRFDRIEDVADALYAELSAAQAVIGELCVEAGALTAAGADAASILDAKRRVTDAEIAMAAFHDGEVRIETAMRKALPGPIATALLWCLGRRRARWLDARALFRAAGLDHQPFDSLVPVRRADLLPAIQSALSSRRGAVEAETTEATAALREAERRHAARERWPRLIGSLAQTGTPADLADAACADPAELDRLLDVTLRPRAFLLAARWWEVQWLIRTRRLQKPGRPFAFLNQPGRAGGEQRFRHMACVTPCFVSTLHMLPRHFALWNPDGSRPGGDKSLTEFIDLLIIDEAGQVAPELGAPSLALARRAVVVGDVHQIEPIPAVSVAADEANLARSGFTEVQAATIRTQGLAASTGSLMQAAHAATAFASPGDEGVFLNEHRRCPREIVGFCNDLVYGGRLLPMTPDAERRLPPLGWANVRGVARKVGSGWRNDQEAAEIAGWLARRRAEIEAWFDDEVSKVVAIVTPYAGQATALRAALAAVGAPGGLTVGTIHALQGAERQIVMFSPTVTAGALEGPPFFDKTPNMLISTRN